MLAAGSVTRAAQTATRLGDAFGVQYKVLKDSLLSKDSTLLFDGLFCSADVCNVQRVAVFQGKGDIFCLKITY